MRITGGILAGTTTYVPGDEARLLTGPDRKTVDWDQLESAGLVVFDNAADRLRCLDPKAAKLLRDAEAKAAKEAKARGAAGGGGAAEDEPDADPPADG